MNILKLAINSNCIMGCCNTNSWNYNETELLHIIKTNSIEKVIIFTPCLSFDKDKILKMINFIYNNFSNIKIIIRTIFYRVDIVDIIELSYHNFSYIEFTLNEKTNFFKNQLELKEIILDKISNLNNKIFIANMIYNNCIDDIKLYVIDKLLSNTFNKTNVVRLNTDLSLGEITPHFSKYNNIIIEKDYASDNVIELCYYNCNNINIYKNAFVFYIEK